MGKRFALAILSPVFAGLLIATAFDWGLVKTIGHPSNVKNVLAASGLYQTVIPSLLKQTGTISTSYGDVSLNNPTVQAAAQKAVPTSEVQKNAEAAIDNIYAWLDGETPQPNFNLNFTNAQPALADNLAAQLQQKLSGLPACTSYAAAASFDPLNASCLPPGVTPKAAADALASEVKSNSSFMDSLNIRSADIKSADTGQSVFASPLLKNAPKDYQRLKKLPVVLLALSVLVGVGLIFLRPTVASGLRHVGVTLLFTGLVMLVFGWAFGRLVNSQIIPRINPDIAVVKQKSRDAVRQLGGDVAHNYYAFGVGYGLAGILCLAAPLAKRPPKPAPEGQSSSR